MRSPAYTAKIRIAVVGAGAIGLDYGGKWRHSTDVHFLLRSGYEVVRKKGLHLE